MYVGQTIQTVIQRWKHHKKRSAKSCFFLKRAINKYGEDNFIVETIDVALSKKELDEKEIYWIAFYKSDDRKFGYNYNKGGTGNTGYRHTEESRKKMSIGVTKNHPTRGKRLPEQHRFNISKSNTGKKCTKETKEKISKTLTGKYFQGPKTEKFIKTLSKINEPRKKKVVCVETGVVYDSISNCAKSMSLKREKIILVVNGKRNKTGGFSFKFVDESQKISAENLANNRIANNKRYTKLFCNETNIMYSSIKEASKKLNVDRSRIFDFLNGKCKSVKGFTFRRM